MATVNLIKATARSRAGKGAARAERRAGRVPGIIYGDGKPPLPISLDYADLHQRIYAGRFLTTIHDVEIDGVKHRVIPARLPARRRARPAAACRLHAARRGRHHPRQHSDPRQERRAVAGRQTRRHGQHRHPHHRGALPRRRHSDRHRRRRQRARDQLFQASERHHACRKACASSPAATSHWSRSCRRQATRKK